MKRILGVFLLVISAIAANASHIVGGEFEIIYIGGNSYRVNFILYFDLVSGNAGARDPQLTAFIYSKRQNLFMDSVVLADPTETKVKYTQPQCSIGSIQTSKIVYNRTIILSPAIYNDPEGYYIVWQRCCRNYNGDGNSAGKLVNIYSIDPLKVPNTPDFAGQTFYLEFPAVVKDGKRFINSSPQLFPPLSDYACVGKPYYKDFGGVDKDGDSLVYSMITPLNTTTSEAIPRPPRPAPYRDVKWKNPFALDNIIGGHPDLKISKDGLLTATPGSVVGLFVFAVRCEEFRNGEKIGELRRDFQMYILDCGAATPPKIVGKKRGDSDFTYKDKMSLTFSNTVTDEERCIQVKVSDADVFSDGSEVLTIRAVAIGFKKDVSSILPATKKVILNGTDSTAVFDICFDQCPFVENGPFKIAIIIGDDACSLPLLDSINLTVNIQKPDNVPPYFTTSDVDETIPESLTRSWLIAGRDDDLDPLVISVVTDGFVPAEAGITITETRHENGFYEARLDWNADCSVFDFTHRTDFVLKMVLDDADECNFDKPDTMRFDLSTILPGNKQPVINSSLSASEIKNGVDRKIYQNLNFTVFGNDEDNDFLELIVEPVTFELSKYEMHFTPAEAKAFVSSPFSWFPDCRKVNINQKDKFELRFIVKDETNKCRFKYADTLIVDVSVHPPDNLKPQLSVTNLSDEVELTTDRHMSAITGQQIQLQFKSVDNDTNPADKIKIELVEAKGTDIDPVGYTFTPSEGNISIQSPFTWNIDCGVYKGPDYDNEYSFKFKTIDDRCFNAKYDTIVIGINLKDIDGKFEEFLPPNIITPNNDGCNDFFAVEGFFSEVANGQCDKVQNLPHLPNDNCRGNFSSIRIYNRWGIEVFQSTKRDFRWYAEHENAGIFFYTITFTNPEGTLKDIVYKGSITVRI
jgi:hypothetical protein